jgi:tripartite-type tricarboxylate transporter receptor subunit TctC
MGVKPSNVRIRARATSQIANVLGISAALAGLLGVTSKAVGQPADFYRGKSVEILVGFSPGGGYDGYARALARTIGNHIPGNPQVLVKNFTGAGSLRLARFLQDVAPRDGLAFGTIDNGLMIASLMNPSVGFDAPKLGWVGSMAKELQICMTWHASRFRSIDDMRGAEAVFGATGRDDIRYTSTNVLRQVSGAKIKIVTGYPGTNDIRLALERGEIDGVCESWSSIKATKPDWLEQKKINIIVQFSFQERPDLPGVPPIGNYAGSPTQADALRLIFSSAETGRPFGAPPAIPADRLDALRRAFDATMKDPEFVDLTTKAKFDVEPSTGEQTAAFLERAHGSPPAAIDAARKLLEQ